MTSQLPDAFDLVDRQRQLPEVEASAAQVFRDCVAVNAPTFGKVVDRTESVGVLANQLVDVSGGEASLMPALQRSSRAWVASEQ